jgi:hypothetical protein
LPHEKETGQKSISKENLAAPAYARRSVTGSPAYATAAKGTFTSVTETKKKGLIWLHC